MTANSWPGGHRHAMHQSEHEVWNANNYPGTLQLCCECDEPTGRCEEDGIWNIDGEPLCQRCSDENNNGTGGETPGDWPLRN